MPTEEQLEKRAILKRRIATVQHNIVENIEKLLSDKLNMPTTELIRIYENQDKLSNTVIYLSNLGETLFRGFWADQPIVGMNGHQIKSDGNNG